MELLSKLLTSKNWSNIKRKFPRFRDQFSGSEILWFNFEEWSILRLFEERAREIGPGKFFMGENSKWLFLGQRNSVNNLIILA